MVKLFRAISSHQFARDYYKQKFERFIRRGFPLKTSTQELRNRLYQKDSRLESEC